MRRDTKFMMRRVHELWAYVGRCRALPDHDRYDDGGHGWSPDDSANDAEMWARYYAAEIICYRAA